MGRRARQSLGAHYQNSIELRITCWSKLRNARYDATQLNPPRTVLKPTNKRKRRTDTGNLGEVGRGIDAGAGHLSLSL